MYDSHSYIWVIFGWILVSIHLNTMNYSPRGFTTPAILTRWENPTGYRSVAPRPNHKLDIDKQWSTCIYTWLLGHAYYIILYIICIIYILWSAMNNFFPVMVKGLKNVTQLHFYVWKVPSYPPTSPPFPPQRMIIRAFLRESHGDP